MVNETINEIYAVIESLKVINDNNLKKLEVEDLLITLVMKLKY
ncbi:hypothetical protein [Spiroplasma ixodetis]|nr:hypothetical protein [Spiroplasma ixodetis]WJG69931.1 hypothetical protein SIXOD_v1c09250 [Spiroplasma ixodetis Y32]